MSNNNTMSDNRSNASAIKIEYTYFESSGKIVFPPGKPFDGSNVLVHVKGKGWCEARWIPGDTYHTMDGPILEGFEWCCLDDTFSAELEEVDFWMPLPELEYASTLRIKI